MTIRGANIGVPCDSSSSANCTDLTGCFNGAVCPDFTIKRHDTKPAFKVSVEDCDGAIDLQDENLVLEVNMWANAKLKKAIDNEIDYFALADNIGFEQVMVGDIIIMQRARRPEHMLVTAFDETNCFIQVQRGYHGTPAVAWKKGTPLKIFRVLGDTAEIETTIDDVIQEDGTVLEDQLIETFLVYEWTSNSTCLAGCYWLEFKLLQMTEESMSLMSLSTTTASVTPSFTPSTLSATDFGCFLGEGVEWARRFPASSDGFLIKIYDSPTAEIA